MVKQKFKVPLISGSNIDVYAANEEQAIKWVKNMGYKVLGIAIISKEY